MMRLNAADEERSIHICIIDFVACDDVDICLVKDYDSANV